MTKANLMGFVLNANCKQKAEFLRQFLLLQIAGQLAPVSLRCVTDLN